jgi:DNA invertase Pin-like site-specific DNA recombinase
MKSLAVAIYARGSSDQQTDAHTIASQLSALRARVVADGFPLPDELQFIDEGYSGATLVRPGLERLRDLIAAGGVERLYGHSPDRLARKYAYQVLLMDEFQRAGVEVIFLNRELGRSPADEVLLQVQGMVAEYERAKILERSRRGKRHAAHAGVVSVLCGAPYGYHYISKPLGGGVARFDIVEPEARVVRQVFTLGRPGAGEYRRGVPALTAGGRAAPRWPNALGSQCGRGQVEEPRLQGDRRLRQNPRRRTEDTAARPARATAATPTPLCARGCAARGVDFGASSCHH